MDEPKVRIKRTTDKSLIRVLAEHCFDPRALTRRHLNGAVWWVAWVDGEAAGFCGLYKDRDGFWWMVLSGVLTDYRGHGIQRRMIQVRVNHVRRQGDTKVLTYVYPTNTASLRSVVQMGFVPYNYRGKFVYLCRSL